MHDQNASSDEQVINVSRKRKTVMCTTCKKLQSTVSDVETRGGADHLFLVAPNSNEIKDMVGVLHTSDVHRHIAELESELPWRLEALTIWYGQGHRALDVNRELKAFRSDSPGNWFNLTPRPASVAISRLLFGGEDAACAEPGISILDVDSAA